MCADELVEWYRARIAPGGSHRRRICVGVYGRQHELPTTLEDTECTLVTGEEGILAWKREQSFYPPVVKHL